ncbi:MAG: hypothetical protein F4204_10335 [Rhodospirillaceae bacterium]|nr:hypothetical protein [Rhodospirillaceae bacterium]
MPASSAPAGSTPVETFDYRHSPLPVREGLAASQRRAWTRLAEPGEWWPGAVRIAIAEETRAAPACAFCAERKAALSPYAVSGRHTAATDLPDVLVDTVHRIRTDPERLTRRFCDAALAGGLSDGEYAETVAVVATVVAVDTFCDAMGLPRHALPEPVAGEPRRRRPPGAKPGLAWIATVAPEDVTEGEAGMYDGLAGVNIHRALSLAPAEVAGFFDLDAEHYLPDAQLRDFGVEYRALTHAQIEFLAARVSAINQCVY